MNPIKSDRRVVKTRNLLRSALMSLIIEKGYQAVTVQDILDRANVGRSTFYAHFADKDALMLSGFDELIAYFREQFQPVDGASVTEESARRLSLLIFEHAEQTRPMFKALMGRQGSDLVHRQGHRYLTQVARGYLQAAVPQGLPGGAPLEMVVQYVVTAFLALLMWWLEQEPPLPAAEMNEYYWKLTLPGVKNLL